VLHKALVILIYSVGNRVKHYFATFDHRYVLISKGLLACILIRRLSNIFDIVNKFVVRLTIRTK
jgi:hypothetical protein